MASTLYEEAIEAAEEIKIAAEEKVRQRLVESMTPQIKKLVEDNLFEKKQILNDEEISEECGNYEGAVSKESKIKEDTKEDIKDSEEDTAALDLSDDSKATLATLLSPSAESKVVERKLSEIKQTKKALEELIIAERNNTISNEKTEEISILQEKLLKEVENIGTNSIFKKDNDLLSEYIEISKEIKTMSRRRKNYLNEDIEQLLEMDLLEQEDPEADSDNDLEALLDSEMMSDEDDKDMQETDGDSSDLMSMLDNISDTVEDAKQAAEQMMSGDMGGEEMADEMADEMDDEDEMAGGGEEEEGMDGDDLIEIDENILRAEIARMRNARKISESKHDISEDLTEEDLTEEDLTEDKYPVSEKVQSEAAELVRQNRVLESKLGDYRKAMDNLQNQLNEMNLFNAKLLYANKLMQNKNLSNNQQKKIVESLDEAKTINEAKLLFESLSKSLTKTKPNRSLNESASRRVLSSGSKAVGSAQSKGSSNVALDRWALLAGIRQ